MTYAGVDFDTHAVHVVLLSEEGAAEYHRFPLEGHDAFERTRAVRDALPTRSDAFWDEVVALGIEEPAGRLTGRMFRVQGAILACLPASLLVEKFMPSEWRSTVGLPGNASKTDVMKVVYAQRLASDLAAAFQGEFKKPEGGWAWPQDACDAYCLALAVSKLTEDVAA